MSADTALFALLSASAGVGALVADRIYPDTAPQDVARPLVVYERAGTTIERTIGGAVAAAITTINVGCYANTYASSEAIADAVVASLTGSTLDVVGRSGGFDPDAQVYSATLTVAHYE